MAETDTAAGAAAAGGGVASPHSSMVAAADSVSPATPAAGASLSARVAAAAAVAQLSRSTTPNPPSGGSHSSSGSGPSAHPTTGSVPLALPVSAVAPLTPFPAGGVGAARSAVPASNGTAAYASSTPAAAAALASWRANPAPLFVPSTYAAGMHPSAASAAVSAAAAARVYPVVPASASASALASVPYPVSARFHGAHQPGPSPAQRHGGASESLSPSASAPPAFSLTVEHALHLPLLPAGPVGVGSATPRAPSASPAAARLTLPNTYVTFSLHGAVGDTAAPSSAAAAARTRALAPSPGAERRLDFQSPAHGNAAASPSVSEPETLSGVTPVCLQSVCPRWNYTRVFALGPVLAAATGGATLASMVTSASMVPAAATPGWGAHHDEGDPGVVTALERVTFLAQVWHRPLGATGAVAGGAKVPHSPYTRQYGATFAAEAVPLPADELIGSALVPLGSLLRAAAAATGSATGASGAAAAASSSSSALLSHQQWYPLMGTPQRAPVQLSIALSPNASLRSLLRRHAAGLAQRNASHAMLTHSPGFHTARSATPAAPSPYWAEGVDEEMEQVHRRQAVQASLRRAAQLGSPSARPQQPQAHTPKQEQQEQKRQQQRRRAPSPTRTNGALTARPAAATAESRHSGSSRHSRPRRRHSDRARARSLSPALVLASASPSASPSPSNSSSPPHSRLRSRSQSQSASRSHSRSRSRPRFHPRARSHSRPRSRSPQRAHHHTKRGSRTHARSASPSRSSSASDSSVSVHSDSDSPEDSRLQKAPSRSRSHSRSSRSRSRSRSHSRSRSRSSSAARLPSPPFSAHGSTSARKAHWAAEERTPSPPSSSSSQAPLSNGQRAPSSSSPACDARSPSRHFSDAPLLCPLELSDVDVSDDTDEEEAAHAHAPAHANSGSDGEDASPGLDEPHASVSATTTQASSPVTQTTTGDVNDSQPHSVPVPSESPPSSQRSPARAHRSPRPDLHGASFSPSTTSSTSSSSSSSVYPVPLSLSSPLSPSFDAAAARACNFAQLRQHMAELAQVHARLKQKFLGEKAEEQPEQQPEQQQQQPPQQQPPPQQSPPDLPPVSPVSAALGAPLTSVDTTAPAPAPPRSPGLDPAPASAPAPDPAPAPASSPDSVSVPSPAPVPVASVVSVVPPSNEDELAAHIRSLTIALQEATALAAAQQRKQRAQRAAAAHNDVSPPTGEDGNSNGNRNGMAHRPALRVEAGARFARPRSPLAASTPIIEHSPPNLEALAKLPTWAAPAPHAAAAAAARGAGAGAPSNRGAAVKGTHRHAVLSVHPSMPASMGMSPAPLSSLPGAWSGAGSVPSPRRRILAPSTSRRQNAAAVRNLIKMASANRARAILPPGVTSMRALKEAHRSRWPTLNQLLAATRAHKVKQGAAAASNTSPAEVPVDGQAQEDQHDSQPDTPVARTEPSVVEHPSADAPVHSSQSPQQQSGSSADPLPPHTSAAVPADVSTQHEDPAQPQSQPQPNGPEPLAVKPKQPSAVAIEAAEAHERERHRVQKTQMFNQWQASLQAQRNNHITPIAPLLPASIMPTTAGGGGDVSVSLMPLVSPNSLPVLLAGRAHVPLRARGNVPLRAPPHNPLVLTPRSRSSDGGGSDVDTDGGDRFATETEADESDRAFSTLSSPAYHNVGQGAPTPASLGMIPKEAAAAAAPVVRGREAQQLGSSPFADRTSLLGASDISLAQLGPDMRPMDDETEMDGDVPDGADEDELAAQEAAEADGSGDGSGDGDGALSSSRASVSGDEGNESRFTSFEPSEAETEEIEDNDNDVSVDADADADANAGAVANAGADAGAGADGAPAAPSHDSPDLMWPEMAAASSRGTSRFLAPPSSSPMGPSLSPVNEEKEDMLSPQPPTNQTAAAPAPARTDGDAAPVHGIAAEAELLHNHAVPARPLQSELAAPSPRRVSPNLFPMAQLQSRPAPDNEEQASAQSHSPPQTGPAATNGVTHSHSPAHPRSPALNSRVVSPHQTPRPRRRSSTSSSGTTPSSLASVLTPHALALASSPSTGPITAADLRELQEAVAALDAARKAKEVAQADEWTKSFETKWTERQAKMAKVAAAKKRLARRHAHAHALGHGHGHGHTHASLNGSGPGSGPGTGSSTGTGFTLPPSAQASRPSKLSRSVSQPVQLMTLRDPHEVIQSLDLMSPSSSSASKRASSSGASGEATNGKTREAGAAGHAPLAAPSPRHGPSSLATHSSHSNGGSSINMMSNGVHVASPQASPNPSLSPGSEIDGQRTTTSGSPVSSDSNEHDHDHEHGYEHGSEHMLSLPAPIGSSAHSASQYSAAASIAAIPSPRLYYQNPRCWSGQHGLTSTEGGGCTAMSLIQPSWSLDGDDEGDPLAEHAAATSEQDHQAHSATPEAGAAGGGGGGVVGVVDSDPTSASYLSEHVLHERSPPGSALMMMVASEPPGVLLPIDPSLPLAADESLYISRSRSMSLQNLCAAAAARSRSTSVVAAPWEVEGAHDDERIQQAEADQQTRAAADTDEQPAHADDNDAHGSTNDVHNDVADLTEHDLILQAANRALEASQQLSWDDGR